MSDIIQRTMASLPGLFSNAPMGGPSSTVQGPNRSFGVSNNMLVFIQNFSNVKSKYAEEQLVQRELSLQKQKLTSPSQTTAQKRESLVRLLYCHLLGYDVSFAYIHAVKLAQLGTILEKRVGYLACAAFLHDNHELSMLLINTIHRDLNSTNILEVCSALVAAGHLVSSELIPSLLPSVKEKLKHSKEIIRRKSVLCLRAFIMKVPDLSSQLKPCLNQALSDKDPGVMWAAVEAYHHLIQANASAYVDLVPALVDILEQVISRKLPSQFDYHTVPAPWLTISIIRILALLGTTGESVGKQITPVLEDVLHRTEANRKAGLAIVYETLLTIAAISADSSLMSLASKHVTRFLSAKQLNLRYIGIKVLSAVVRVDDRYALDHQSAVLDCLEHEDVTIQKTTLHMLCNMANAVNKVVICNHLQNYANRTTDHFSKVDIITKVLDIIDRLSDSVKWYIDEVTKILETNGQFAPQGTANKLIQVIKYGIPNDETCEHTDRHRYALDVCWNKLKSEKLSEPLLQVAVWTVGEYCHLDAALVPGSIISCLLDWYRNCTSSQVRKWILSALCKRRDFIERPSEALEILKTASNPNDKNLLQRLHELETLCTVSSEVKEMLSTQNVTRKMDFSLSFLDDFVSEALELGALPYRAASLRFCQPAPPKLEPTEVPPSISDLFVASYEASGVPVIQPSPVSVLSSSLLSQESSEAGSTEQRDGMNLKMKGVRVVWGKDGLIKRTADNREKQDLGPEMGGQSSATSDDLLNVLKPVDSEATHKEEERRNLASALFGGIRASSKELHQEQEKPAVKSVTEIDFITESSQMERTDEIKLSDNDLSDRPDDLGTLENNFRKSLDQLAEIDFEASENHPTERSDDRLTTSDNLRHPPDDHRSEVVLGERSISPDSIESEGENASSAQLPNPVSAPGSGNGCSEETPCFENLKVSSKTQSFTLPKSLHANAAEVSEKTDSNNSLVGQYLRSKAVASNSSVSWHPSLSQSNNFGVPQQLFSSIEVQNSTGNEFAELFTQQDNIGFSSPNCESTSHVQDSEDLPYLNLKTDSATSSESWEHSKKECSEFEVSVESFTNNLKQNSEKGRTDTVGPIVNVYESEIVSVVCQKYCGNIRSLQLLVTCCRQNLADPVLFFDTSICVVNCSTVYQTKFITDEGLMDTVSLADLSGNSNYIEILLNVLPFSVQSICQSDQLSLTLYLRAPSRGFQATVTIPVVLPEFLRPFECSLQMYADLWASFRHQSQMVVPCVQQDIVMTAHLLANRCLLHVVRISGQECILSGQVLDFENSQVLLHVKITDSQTESLLHLWMKSCDRIIVEKLMPAIIILLRD